MNLAELRRHTATGESETMEFKKSTAELTAAGETLCAFLNTSGGMVFIGVLDDGHIIGQDIGELTERDVAQMLMRIEPAGSVRLDKIALPGTDRQVIVLEVDSPSETLPYVYSGRPYRRIGPTTSIMPQEQYQSLLLSRVHERSRWENTPADGVTLDSLDIEQLLRTVRSGVAVGRLPESTGSNPAELLEKLGLSIKGQLLNAAVVTFGTRFLPYYPQCHLRLARFKGCDKTEFLDNRQLQGHGFTILDESMTFLQRHLPVASRIEADKLQRIDEPLFPLEALREAVVNAISHRDYSIAGGAVNIAIYDDRVEIWSDGTLPFGLKVEDLKREHRSRPRNPIIAGVFYRHGVVESWGRGTQKIVELCVKAGHPQPEFLEEAGCVGVRFLPAGYSAPYRVGYDLSNRQREILSILATGSYAVRDIMEKLVNPPSSVTVRDDLYQLKQLGLIGLTGRARKAKWHLTRG